MDPVGEPPASAQSSPALQGRGHAHANAPSAAEQRAGRLMGQRPGHQGVLARWPANIVYPPCHPIPPHAKPASAWTGAEAFSRAILSLSCARCTTLDAGVPLCRR